MEWVKRTLSLALVFSQFSQINAKPSFLLTLTQFDCTVNPDYADPPNCYFNTSSTGTWFYGDIQMHREVKNQQYELNIDINVNKRKRNLLHMKKSACAFFEGRVTAILKVIKNILDSRGKLPKKCPVDKDFRYLFKDVIIDSSMLPAILMEAEFHLTTRNTEGSNLVFFLDVKGRVIRN